MNGWQATVKCIQIMTERDELNYELNKTALKTTRERLSKRIDSLDAELFELKNKLKNLTV